MKRTAKFIICAVFCAVFVHIPSVSAETCGSTLEYVVSGGEAVVTGCKGSPSVLCIPERIEGKRVTGIRENAFYKCVSVRRAVIPRSALKIGHHAFYGCRALEEVRIEGEIQVLPEGCFEDCGSLERVSLPQSLLRIEDSCFGGCGRIERIVFPSGLEKIGKSAFEGCSSLKTADLPEGLLIVGDRAFYGCGAGSVEIPDSLNTIGRFAFGYGGKQPTAKTGFTVTGSSSSLAGDYARECGFSDGHSERRSDSGIFRAAAAAALAALAGLLLLRILSGAGDLELKYEYEG